MSDRGYVALAATTATKTDEPLTEVPQAISVITRDQMDEQGVSSVPQALLVVPPAVLAYFLLRAKTAIKPVAKPR